MGKEKKIDNSKYLKCNHIWIVSMDSILSKQCIKCGLTDRVFRQDNVFSEQVDKEMRNFILDHTSTLIKGKKLDCICDFEMASLVYNKILIIHKEIDDEKLLKYMSIAINNMKEKELEKTQKKIKKIIKK